MQGDSTVIKHLNIILTNELTAVNQYFLHARMIKNWGILGLAKKIEEESFGEMKHADMLIERVLMIDGLPNLQDLHKLFIGETVPEMFQGDLKVESKNQKDLKAAIAYCLECEDAVSRGILETILDDTEEHIDWLETQVGLIDLVGTENYLQKQMFEGANG